MIFMFLGLVANATNTVVKNTNVTVPLCFVVELTGGTFCYHCHHICDACERGDLKTRAEILQFCS